MQVPGVKQALQKSLPVSLQKFLPVALQKSLQVALQKSLPVSCNFSLVPLKGKQFVDKSSFKPYRAIQADES